MADQFTRRYRRRSTSMRTGKTYEYNIEITDLDAKESAENIALAAAVVGGAAITAVATVSATVITIICLLGMIPIALSSWPLFPLLISTGALACILSTTIRAISGTIYPIAIAVIGIFVSIPISFIGMYAHGNLAEPLLQEQPRWEDRYASFIHLPWIAVVCIIASLLIVIRKYDKKLIIPCAIFTAMSIIFTASNAHLDQITAALNLALSAPIVAWFIISDIQRKNNRKNQSEQWQWGNISP